MFNNKMFSTLRLRNGDIDFDNLGKLYFITNEESVAQSINIRLMTELGDLFYDELFGLEKRWVKNTLPNVMTLESEIRKALIDDEKIIDAQLIDVIMYNNDVRDAKGNFLNGSAILKIAVTLFDQTQVFTDINMDGEIE